MPDATYISGLLRQLRAGEPEAAGQLFPLIYGEPRRIAKQPDGSRRPRPYAASRRTSARSLHADGRRTGRRLAGPRSRIRRAVHAASADGVCAAAPGRQARRRSRGSRLDLDAVLLIGDDRLADVIARRSLQSAHGHGPDQARIVGLRFHGGLNVEETAEAVGVSRRTVKRECQMTRSWLDRETRGRKPV